MDNLITLVLPTGIAYVQLHCDRRTASLVKESLYLPPFDRIEGVERAERLEAMILARDIEYTYITN